MPRRITSLIREEADLHALVTLSAHDSSRELRRLLSVARIVEEREDRRRYAVLRLWAARAAIAMTVVAVIAVYVVMVQQLQMPITTDPFE
jgi:hypothetical protein